MTRVLFVLALLLFIGMVAMTILGLTSNTPGLLFLGLLLCGPGFMFTLGLAIGRASAEFKITRREDDQPAPRPVVSNRRPRQQQREPLA